MVGSNPPFRGRDLQGKRGREGDGERREMQGALVWVAEKESLELVLQLKRRMRSLILLQCDIRNRGDLNLFEVLENGQKMGLKLGMGSHAGRGSQKLAAQAYVQRKHWRKTKGIRRAKGSRKPSNWISKPSQVPVLIRNKRPYHFSFYTISNLLRATANKPSV